MSYVRSVSPTSSPPWWPPRPGIIPSDPTSLGFRLGVVSRIVPLVVAAVCLVAAVAGSALVGLVPTPVVAGLLLFLGLGFMDDWLIDRRRQMSGLCGPGSRRIWSGYRWARAR